MPKDLKIQLHIDCSLLDHLVQSLLMLAISLNFDRKIDKAMKSDFSII